MSRKYEESIPKSIKFIKGTLNYNFTCSGCGERINKATGLYCHACEGGYDIHQHAPAISLLSKKS